MTETKVSDVVFGAILLAGGVILFWFLSQFASLLFSASPPRGCLEIVERLCEQTAEKQSENACRFPRSGEKFRHGSLIAFDLLKELSAAIQEDK